MHRIARFLAVCAVAYAAPAPEPSAARNAHFEVYSQAGEDSARSVLLGFERLRAFFKQQTGIPQQTAWQVDNRPPVRVIVFADAAEYAPYRLQPTTDAFYVGNEGRDYIVMVQPQADDFRVAAHEYAHVVLHANGLRLPPWLDEGLPEFFSAVGTGALNPKSGAGRPFRSRVLQTKMWMPLAELLSLPVDAPLREQPDGSELYYAESWALTHLQMASPRYSGRFSDLFTALAAGTPSPEAIAAAYGRSLEEITRDLRVWIRKRRIAPTPLPAVSPGDGLLQVTPVTPVAWRSLLAEVLLVTGKVDRAETAYQQLAQEAPKSPEFPAALAAIALQKSRWDDARQWWRRALDQGINDADTCYRYAVLANAAGFSSDDIRPALARAVAARPSFDDALYMLAPLESNAGQYEAAIKHLRAMRQVTAARQYPYWILMAYAEIELGRRYQAEAAARLADEHATTPDERQHAAQLAEIAQTDVTVQFTRDANGNPRLVTRRVPHDTPDWNPFIEPGDFIRRVEGELAEIDCSGGVNRILVETSGGRLIIDIPDPKRVQMRNAPDEFTCGPQPRNAITVIYAVSKTHTGSSDGVVRGLEFR